MRNTRRDLLTWDRLHRYPITIGIVAIALASMAILDREGVETYAPMIGAIALSCWYAGIRTGLAATVVGWATAWFLFATPGSSLVPTREEQVRGAVSILVSLVIVWFSWAIGRARERAETRAHTAERQRSVTGALQRLTEELSAAVSPSDVAHALVERMPGLLGATGAALGLREGDVLQIVDPEGSPQQTLTPGMQLPIGARAPITTAARTGEPVHASTRASFEREFPDGAALAPRSQGALAVPLVSGGRVVGAMGMPFADAHAVDDEMIALARLAADLGGQALERASLYEQERHSREALDGILQLAPRFDSESPESVAELVCQEALRTFDADIAHVWEDISADSFEVVWREPRSEDYPVGLPVSKSNYPGLAASLEHLQPMFIRDSWVSVLGQGLEHARLFGIRSSLRVPIAVRGKAERLLVLQWRRIIPEPPASQILLARRFADQAGLALEHAGRRAAQRAAAQSADETQRLLDVTAALSTPLDPVAAAGAILDEAFRGLETDAGAVVRLEADGQLRLLAAAGYAPAVLEGWESFALETEAPIAEAVRRNRIVALESAAERARRFPSLPKGDGTHGAWLSIPLVAGGRAVGGLGLSFPAARTFSDADRAFAMALASQAGQALERSSLLETEHAARMRAERMASDLAQLHALATSLAQAGSTSEVAQIVEQQTIDAVGASGTAIFLLSRHTGECRLLESNGRLEREHRDGLEHLARWDDGLIRLAISNARPLWILDGAAWEAFPEAAWWRDEAGADSIGVIPVVVEHEPVAALVVTFDDGPPARDDRRYVETIASQAAQPLERSRLFDEEQSLRLRADRAQRLTAALSGAVEIEEVVDVFLEEIPAAVAASDAAIGLVDPYSALTRFTRWNDPAGIVPEAWWSDESGVDTPVRDAVASGTPLYFASSDEILGGFPSAEELVGGGNYESVAVVPIGAWDSRPLAVTILAWRTAFSLSADEQAFIATMASQCGVALDRAGRYEAERTIAETLQRSVLPETFPAMEGATVAARYLPGTAAIDVGGDWFDTLTLRNGHLAFVVGDVVGKGIEAASTMAQLRNGMRAFTLDSSDPGAIVTKLNRLLSTYTEAPFATLGLLTLDPATNEAWLISAGHLPPLVLAPGHEPLLLDGGRGLPLGVDPDTIYEAWQTTLAPGSVILLYTDGLVERRDRPLDDGLDLLVQALREAPRDPGVVVQRALDSLIGEGTRGDDIAVLAIALDASPLGPFSLQLPADQTSLGGLREALGAWLERGGISGADRRDLVLAAWEASANAIEHAREPLEATIDVQAVLTGDRICIEVSDSGQWQEPRERPDRGLGLRLMQALMTSLKVEHNEGGTTVVMERALSRERAGEGEGDGADHRAP